MNTHSANTSMTDDELIQQYIEPNPHRPGPDRAWLVDEGISVWILVASAQAHDDDIAQVAETYGISHDAVRAALAYYRRNQDVIDARITIEHASFS